ncbi:MAG: DinB family protein [Balneolaceae bacterium]|nr:DinB family protein [Balneolaceae bacterium]MBO6546706.1 DinB family protein [Balneolaceae bacterium]MBO6649064.1 DinB family protein [Balneolaceae bacterium]
MHEDWIERIDRNTSLFKENFEGLSYKELNWKPTDDSWSIGQIIEHIILINESYFEVFDKLKTGSLKVPFTARFQSVNSFFLKILSQATEPSRQKKMKTMNPWNPSKKEVPKEIFSRFSLNQEILKEYVNSLEGYIKDKSIIYSPMFRGITFPVDEFIEELVNHELRHFNQAKEVLGKLNKSNSQTV